MDDMPLTPRDDEYNLPSEPTPGEPEGEPIPPVAEQSVSPEPHEEVIAEQPSPESLPPPPPPPFPSYGTLPPESGTPSSFPSYGTPPPPPPPFPSYGTPSADFGAPSGYVVPARSGPNWLLIVAIVLGICMLLACLMIVVLAMLGPTIGNILSNTLETLEATP